MTNNRLYQTEEDYQVSEENRVVVYGDCIQSYSCIAALLELGIQPKFIVFVEPFPDLEEPTALRVNCFNDETVCSVLNYFFLVN